MKKLFCIGVLGLSPESVYGTEEQKNAPTEYKWSNFAHVQGIPQREGFMSGRDIMQYAATEIFRMIDPDIWVKRTKEAIEKAIIEWNPRAIILSDVRFINEANGIHGIGGELIRLTRKISDTDKHRSEIELDDYEEFDFIIDNAASSIPEQCQAMNEIMEKHWNWK